LGENTIFFFINNPLLISSGTITSKNFLMYRLLENLLWQFYFTNI